LGAFYFQDESYIEEAIMKKVKLNNGIEMPILGFGVYKIDDPAQCEQCVTDAIGIGYRLFDTAAIYKNEEPVGRAIKSCGVPREEFFVTTKVWIQDAGYERTKKAFETSLKKLQLDYVDLYLIHRPYGDVYGSWRALEELYKQGKIRAIGVSNFEPGRLVDLIMYNEIAPTVNQVETHVFCQQIESAKVMKEYHVQIESWAPFAQGRNNMFKNETLVEIANRYDKSVAQVILRWLIQRDVAVIPKSAHKERMIENFDVFDFELIQEDMDIIASLDTNESLFFSQGDVETLKMMQNYKL
jgi:diketogulonate reductase-like aldo/keto reductase